MKALSALKWRMLNLHDKSVLKSGSVGLGLPEMSFGSGDDFGRSGVCLLVADNDDFGVVLIEFGSGLFAGDELRRAPTVVMILGDLGGCLLMADDDDFGVVLIAFGSGLSVGDGMVVVCGGGVVCFE
ncbi:hypothetical protein K7X08_012312 [Anisodus acutangulus]|uniref:Uncharacterized protein n=1 Tax=Anisodus acutangulus TaxID=402998 RepID=A0A9Q1QYZ5_9SOLA|nr:hypothetical protein K7X08_012312 [Anisodus acutangulus]